MKLFTRFSSWFVLLIVILSLQVSAQWSTNPAVNNAISTAINNQTDAKIVSDGSGGAIVVWLDFRSGNYDIYAQRIGHSSMDVQWRCDMHGTK